MKIDPGVYWAFENTIKSARCFQCAMADKFEELPPELWMELERWLSVSDLLQLRVTNKKMLQNISQQQMWKRICYRDWYKYILDEEEIYCKVTDKRKTYEETEDWCVQARRLYHNDYHVIHRIEKLTEIPFGRTFWSKFDIILKGKYDTLLPILYKITTQETERNSAIKYGLELKTCAQHLLDHILHEPFYKLSWGGNEDCYESEYLEPLFLDIAKFDSAYPLISGKILEVRQRLRNKIDEKIDSKWDTFLNDTIKNKARLIILSTLNILRVGECSEHIPDWKYFDEDCFITRIYAGEVVGHGLLLLVILQSMCRQYNIKTRLNQDHLIIEDPTDQYGEFYFRLDISDLVSGFMTRSEMRALLSHDFSVIAPGEYYDLTKYWKPLNAIQCLNLTIKKFLNKSKRSIIRYYLSVDHPDSILNDYSPIYLSEIGKNRYNCMEIKRHVKKLFPYSKRPISRDIALYMINTYHAIRSICGDSPDESTSDELMFGDDFEEPPDIDYNELKSMVKETVPWDYNHIVGSTALVNVCDYIVPRSDMKTVITYDDNYENPIRIGAFMRYKKDELVLIVSQPMSPIEDDKSGLVRMFDCMGPTFGALTESLDNGSTHPITVQEMNAFVDTLAPNNYLGRFFSSYDRETGTGTLNIKMKDTIKRELAKYKVILLKGESHKRQKGNM